VAAGSFCLIDVLAVGHRHLHGSTALGERLNLWQSADDWDGLLGGLAGSRTDVNGPSLIYALIIYRIYFTGVAY